MDSKEIYENCLYKRYHNEKIEPIIRCLYQVVKHYNKELTGSKNDSIEIKNHNKVEFINKLLLVFEKLVEKENNDDLYNTIRLLFSLKIDHNDFINYLYLFYFKEDVYNDNIMDFYEKMKRLCYLVIRYNTFETSNTYLFQLIDCFLMKYQGLSPEVNYYYNKILYFLDYYGHIIISVVYLKYELSDLENILNGIIVDFEDIENYFLLNGINSVFKKIELKDRLDFVMNIINNKRKIKVIE